MSENEANKRQVGGSHYSKHGALQHWDVVAHFGLDYFQGQITKYVMRWKDKNGVQDLEKARHFLDKYIEVAKREEATAPLLKTPSKCHCGRFDLAADMKEWYDMATGTAHGRASCDAPTLSRCYCGRFELAPDILGHRERPNEGPHTRDSCPKMATNKP